MLVKLEGPLKPGDGVVFDAGHPEEKEEGGRVYEVRNAKSKVGTADSCELRFGQGDIDFRRVHVGDKLWKTSDPELDRRLRQSFEGDTPKFQRPIRMEVHGLRRPAAHAHRARRTRPCGASSTPRCRWRRPRNSR